MTVRQRAKPAFNPELTIVELNALSAVRFCLYMGREPFRADIAILCRLVELAYVTAAGGERPSASKEG